mgnify:CR=1 FL=1|jgi:hypothetical protein
MVLGHKHPIRKCKPKIKRGCHKPRPCGPLKIKRIRGRTGPAGLPGPAGPLSSTVTVSASGNELRVGESGIYQITISINAEATTDPDPDQPFLTAIMTVNGSPLFGDTTTFFKISNRSSSTFVAQAFLTADDEVGVSINTDFPALGYMNRSLTIIQLSN